MYIKHICIKKVLTQKTLIILGIAALLAIKTPMEIMVYAEELVGAATVESSSMPSMTEVDTSVHESVSVEEADIDISTKNESVSTEETGSTDDTVPFSNTTETTTSEIVSTVTETDTMKDEAASTETIPKETQTGDTEIISNGTIPTTTTGTSGVTITGEYTTETSGILAQIPTTSGVVATGTYTTETIEMIPSMTTGNTDTGEAPIENNITGNILSGDMTGDILSGETITGDTLTGESVTGDILTGSITGVLCIQTDQIDTLSQVKFVLGMDPTNFLYSKPINRQEALLLLTKAYWIQHVKEICPTRVATGYQQTTTIGTIVMEQDNPEKSYGFYKTYAEKNGITLPTHVQQKAQEIASSQDIIAILDALLGDTNSAQQKAAKMKRKNTPETILGPLISRGQMIKILTTYLTQRDNL